jgi:uncharacterized protein (DUF433 family)
MRFKKTLAAVGTAAALAGGMAVALPALAQDDTATTTTAPDVTTQDSTATESAVRGRHGGEQLSTVADLLGIDTTELRDRLDAGETIADIAAAEGVAAEDIVSTLVAGTEAHLADAVADGRLTQDEADAGLATIEQRITDAVNGDAAFGFGCEGAGSGRGGFGGFDGTALTTVLGIDATELRDRLEAGETIADIAAAEGVALEDVTAALEAAAAERLAQDVTDGRLTQDEANERLADLDDRIDAIVNGEAQLGGRHGFGRGDHNGFGAGPEVDDTAAETANA